MTVCKHPILCKAVGSASHRVAQIMQGAGKSPVPGAGLAAFRTRPMLVISTARNELWGRKHLGIGDAQSRVRRVDCRTKHGVVLLNKRRFSLILSLGPSFVTLKPPVVMLKSPKNAEFGMRNGEGEKVDGKCQVADDRGQMADAGRGMTDAR